VLSEAVTQMNFPISLWIHRAGIATREGHDVPLGVRLPGFGVACECDLRELEVAFPVSRAEISEPATPYSPQWHSVDLELDHRSPTLLDCEGIQSCLVPGVADELFQELSIDSL